MMAKQASERVQQLLARAGGGAVARPRPGPRRGARAALPRRCARADELVEGQGVHGPGGRGALGPVAAQLLPVLRRQVRAAPRSLRGVGPIDGPAPRRARGARSPTRSSASRCSRSSTTACASRCRRASRRRVAPPRPWPSSRSSSSPSTRRRRRARSCHSCALLGSLLDDAAAAGKLRKDLDHRAISGVILQSIMFNAFATTISGTPIRGHDDKAARGAARPDPPRPRRRLNRSRRARSAAGRRCGRSRSRAPRPPSYPGRPGG